MRVIGFAGWSGAGKTTLIVKLIPELNRRGFSVSTIKHAHHNFDLDQPGKDSYAASLRRRSRSAGRFRQSDRADAGIARRARAVAARSFAAAQGRRPGAGRGLQARSSPKIEVFRAANGKPPLYPEDPNIVALISDAAEPPAHLPHASIDDIAAAADLVLAHAGRSPKFSPGLRPVRSARHCYSG